MPNTLRTGLVGVGYGAAVQLPALRDSRNFRVTGLVDGGSGKAALLAREIEECRAFETWRSLVDSPDIDLIVVSTPPKFHLEIATAVLDAGKHLLCEKPLGLPFGDVSDLQRVARASKSLAAIDFEFRYEPGLIALRNAFRAGSVGSAKELRVRWHTNGRFGAHRLWGWQNSAADGGGIIESMYPHVVDYLNWLTDAEITTVSANTRIVIPNRANSKGERISVTAEDECDACFALNFADGRKVLAFVSVSNCKAESYGHAVEIEGELGALSYHHTPPFGPENMTTSLRKGSSQETLFQGKPGGIGDTRRTAFSDLLVDFHASVEAGTPVVNLPSLGIGLKARAILDSIHELKVNEE